MSLEREYQKTILVCDKCFETIECEDFEDAQTYIHQHKWKTKKSKDGEWLHKCISCAFPL